MNTKQDIKNQMLTILTKWKGKDIPKTHKLYGEKVMDRIRYRLLKVQYDKFGENEKTFEMVKDVFEI